MELEHRKTQVQRKKLLYKNQIRKRKHKCNRRAGYDHFKNQKTYSILDHFPNQKRYRHDFARKSSVRPNKRRVQEKLKVANRDKSGDILPETFSFSIPKTIVQSSIKIGFSSLKFARIVLISPVVVGRWIQRLVRNKFVRWKLEKQRQKQFLQKYQSMKLNKAIYQNLSREGILSRRQLSEKIYFQNPYEIP